MRICNPHYFNVYNFSFKPLLVVFCCFWLACNEENHSKQLLPTKNRLQISKSAININTASVAELEKLSNIGVQTAREIIAHREKFGPFRKPEHLLMVRGISDNLYREISIQIKAE